MTTAAPADALHSARAAEPPATPEVSRRRGRWAGRRIAVVGISGLIVVEIFVGRTWLASAASAISTASLRWILLAVALSFASMWCFGAVRQRTLHAAGVEVPVTTAVATSYAAGALHATLPGGAVFSTAYAFRQLRRWGASTTVATWSMTVTGVLAAATLATVALAGIALGRGITGSPIQLIIEMILLAAAFVGVAHVTRRPDALLTPARAGLGLINRLRRRPQTAGFDKLTAVILDLGTIRPTPCQWSSALGLSLANWLFDAACLAACCASVGLDISIPAVLLTYTAGMAAVSVSPLPAGIGVVEGTLALGLTAAGAAGPAALAAVLIYRLISTGGVAAVGWLILSRQRGERHRTPEIVGGAV